MKKLKTIVSVFTILILTSWTATAQTDTTDTSPGILYTIEMDRAAQECWENHAEREAVRKQLEETLAFVNGQYKDLRDEFATLENENAALVLKNDDLKDKVKRNRWGWIGTGILGVGGIILTTTVK